MLLVVVTPKKIRPRLSLRPSTSSSAALDYSSDSSDTVPRRSASSPLASPSVRARVALTSSAAVTAPPSILQVALGRPIFEPRPRTPLTPREQVTKGWFLFVCAWGGLGGVSQRLRFVTAAALLPPKFDTCHLRSA